MRLDPFEVAGQAVHDRQIAIARKVAVERRVGLAPVEPLGADQRVRPEQPAARVSLARDDGEAEQIVQPATVDADRRHLGAVE